IVGIVLGLFLAPQSGAETRRFVGERIGEIIEEAQRAAREKRQELEAQFAAAKQVRRETKE
ncbi:MAG: YtxH domain-containing protein, partial [Anaerolineae bacterium]